ncbi:cysteine hydrolase [Actinospica sp. MGRD01-02]|uniref:Cysteine hydrolase n=1 Tax=Actinospica acidithermotolerans TaxID=2828514 RepID=A0A941EHM4_9ACTN|nr:cysteine hydrolase [Actinospica acidithermotolerans]MBR7829269.1 cysteine hydrolase [Actinospica acidithermotolerans]
MPQSVLLVLDVQSLIVERYADPDYLSRLGRAIDAARRAGTPVWYAQVGFRAGFPEVHPRNKMFGALARAAEDGPARQQPPNEIHPAVAPHPQDIVVTKRRVSAFSGSDLDMLLRAAGVDELVLTGIATSGVILSTLRQAADLDYGLTVLSDACADADPEVHRVLVEKVFPMQADVATVADWAAGL